MCDDSLRDFFYTIYGDLEECVHKGARQVGEIGESVYESPLGSILWIGEVLEAGVSDEFTPKQIAAESILSLAPVVDPIFDIRNLCANCEKLYEDSDNSQSWQNLSFSLIGLEPSLSFLAKGVFRIISSYIRMGGSCTVEEAVDDSKESLKTFLGDQDVVNILRSYDFGKSCKKAAEELRSIKSVLNSDHLTKLFCKATENFHTLIEHIRQIPMVPKVLLFTLDSKYKVLCAIQSQIAPNLDKNLDSVTAILDRIVDRLETHALVKGLIAGIQGAIQRPLNKWMGLMVVGDNLQAIEGILIKYTVTFQDGSVRQGELDSYGRARLENLPPGSATVVYEFPEPQEKERESIDALLPLFHAMRGECA